jgi:hypothetical protein
MNDSSTQWAPVIYEENKVKVLERLREGEVEYMDLSSWSYQDRFFAFLLGTRFFEICGASYPSPRKKEEVPVWFLLCCSVVMRLDTTGAYQKLPGLLKNGPILSRVKFNVGGVDGGFNHKNRTERQAPVHFDGVRKFFRDTHPALQRQWHNSDVIKFYKHNRAFDKHGIFLMDQTHIVVPDNDNYKDAVRMPVDEHGQLLDLGHLTAEQRKGVKYRPCYALSELVHIGKEDNSSIVAGYQWGPGNTDELVHGHELVNGFIAAVGTGVMRLLIVDRGFIQGAFITMVKRDAKSDVLFPLRKDMDMYQRAVIAVESPQWTGSWASYRSYEKDGIRYTEEVATVKNLGLWDECEVPLHLSIMRTTDSRGAVTYWVLASTFEFKSAKEAFEHYEIRTCIEEDHRKFKRFWNISAFTSPNESLVESQVLFTLLTYSLVQLHLVKTHLADLTNKTIDTLKRDERAGTDAVIIYHGKYFGVFDLSEYTYIIADLHPGANQRLKKWIERNRQIVQSPSG